MLDMAIHIAEVIAAVPALLFCITYSRVNWRASAIGRHMMAFMMICSVILMMACLPILFGENYIGEDEVRLFAWVLINFIFWWRFLVLLRVVLRRYPQRQRCPHCGSLL